MHFIYTSILVLFFCIGGAGLYPLWGQIPEAQLLAEVQIAYEAFDFDRVEVLADSAIAQRGVYSSETLSEVFKTLGLAQYARSDSSAARTAFESALSFNPNLTLDPALSSPVIMAFFNGIKETFVQQPEATNPNTSIRYLPLVDPRPAAAMRSMILPGWGQFYKGERSKGLVLIGLWSGLAASTVVAHFRRASTQDAYLAEQDRTLIQDRFDTFNTWHKIRNNLFLAVVGVWAYSYLDALIFRKQPTSNFAQMRGLQVNPTFSSRQTGVQIRLTF